MTQTGTLLPSARLRAGSATCAVLMLAAIGLRRPELVAVAAPLALLLVYGSAIARTPDLEASARIDRLRAAEGEQVELEVELRSAAGIPWLEVELAAPPGLAPAGAPPRRRLMLAAGEPVVLRQTYECRRWGGFAPGLERCRARDRGGLFTYRLESAARVPLRVYPLTETVRSRPAPRRTQLSVGGDVARTKGEGIEHADVRPFVPGDRVRRVNWRLSARLDRPYVNEHHPERNADVVLFLDSFGDDRGWGAAPLDQAVHAAASLAHACLQNRDRVGMVGFGGVLRWVMPASGRVQTHRILDSLIDTQIVASQAWRGVEIIPGRTLPPRALVLALSPLTDPRAVAALGNLRGRGFDLGVIEIAPEPHLPSPAGELEVLARRLWALRREQVRAGYAALGIQVVRWPMGTPVEAAMAGLQEARRSARFASR